MKAIAAILIGMLVLVSLSGCVEERITKESPKVKVCSTDADCVPQPACHPMKCINAEYKYLFNKPHFCTGVFNCGAAYTTADCACIDKVCTNKNEGKTCE